MPAVQENEKASRLEAELELVDEKRAIVFVNTKHKCDIVSRQLDTLSYRCTVLHGGKTQACPVPPPYVLLMLEQSDI